MRKVALLLTGVSLFLLSGISLSDEIQDRFLDLESKIGRLASSDAKTREEAAKEYGAKGSDKLVSTERLLEIARRGIHGNEDSFHFGNCGVGGFGFRLFGRAKSELCGFQLDASKEAAKSALRIRAENNPQLLMNVLRDPDQARFGYRDRLLVTQILTDMLNRGGLEEQLAIQISNTLGHYGQEPLPPPMVPEGSGNEVLHRHQSAPSNTH